MDNISTEDRMYKVAVASGDGIVVNQHFGRADKFYIYEVYETGECKLLEIRTVVPVCSGGNHNDIHLRDNISRFKDCKYILVSRIGIGAADVAEYFGIVPMELPGLIEESVRKLIAFEKIQNLF